MTNGDRDRWERAVRTLPFSIVVSCDFAPGQSLNIEGRAPAQVFLPATVFAIESATTRLFGDAARLRTALGRRFAERVGSSDEERGNDRSINVVDALWELGDRSGFHPAFVVGTIDQAVRDALTQTEPGRGFLLGYWVSPLGPHPSVDIRCEKIAFESGSLKTYLQNFARGTGFALTLLVAGAATQPAVDTYERYRITQEITSIYGGEPFLTSTTIEFDSKALLDAAADDMNFLEPGIDALEKARRTALVQLALDLNGFPVGRIDGVCGQNTQKQLEAFGHKHGIKTGYIGDPNLRRALVRVLHSGAWDLVKR
jgi:hypothetical protein